MICFPGQGGSGVVATELGKELSRKGHEIHLISYEKPFRLEKEEKLYFHKVQMKDYPLFPHPLYTLDLSAKIADILRNYDFQIIHSHYVVPNSISAYLAKEICEKNAPKLVTTIHGTDISVWGQDSLMQPLIRYGLEKSDAVTAVSNSLKAEAQEIISDKNIQVIYNFVNRSFFNYGYDETLRMQLAPNGEKIILHVSNFRPVKRVPDLLSAFALLLEDIQDVVLVLVGDGVERNIAMGMARDLGIEEKVCFVGNVSNPAPLIAVSHFLALASDKESFGLVALEAMACGKPVVATRTGGLSELVEDGKTGFLTPVGDVTKLHASMKWILQNESLYKDLAQNSREKASRFASNIIIPSYERLYTSLVD